MASTWSGTFSQADKEQDRTVAGEIAQRLADATQALRKETIAMTGTCHRQQLDRRVSAVDRHVGSRIRLRRRAVGLAQHQLADLIGVTNQQVHKYEKGIDRITAAQLHAIALALGTDAAFFFEHVELSLVEADDQVLDHRLVDLTRDMLRMAKPEYRQAVCALAKAMAGGSERQPAELT